MLSTPFFPKHTHGRPYDVVAIDGVALDFVMKVERLPGHGEKEMSEFVGRLPGGPGANFACVAARQGLKVASLSTIGGDEAGQIIVDDFANYQVETKFIRKLTDRATAFTVILIEPSGERSIIVASTKKEPYDADIAAHAFSQCRAIQTIPYHAGHFIPLAKIARAHDVKVMIDVEATVGANRSDLENILRQVDIASFNERGLVQISGEKATIDGARKLLAFGPQIVLVTLGSKGALAVTADEAYEVMGIKVDVKDTTGAGDTFNATFLASLLQDLPLPDCLARANAAAAIAVTGLGPRGHLPTTNEIERLLAQIT